MALNSGLFDPLRQLPSMHTLLDVVEAMILEGMQSEEDRDKYYRRVYTPPVGSMKRGRTPPPGWGRDDELDAFDALLDG